MQYGYDAAGNLASVINRAGSTTAYANQFAGNAHDLTSATNATDAAGRPPFQRPDADSWVT